MLMNTDYKKLARIMAGLLNPVLEEQVISSQNGTVPGNIPMWQYRYCETS